MRRADIAIRAIKSLRRAKARTILTSLAIAVGATTICLALAAGNGARDYINSYVSSKGDESVLTVFRMSPDDTPDGPRRLDSMPNDNSDEGIKVDDEQRIFSAQDIADIRSIEGVAYVGCDLFLSTRAIKGVDGWYEVFTSAQLGRDKQPVVFNGVNGDYHLQRGEVAVSDWYLQALGFETSEQAIGRSITLSFYSDSQADSADNADTFEQEFTIIATIERKDQRFGQSVLLSNADGEEISTAQGAPCTGLSVEVTDGYSVGGVQASIAAQHPYNVVRDLRNMNVEMFQAIDMVQWGLAGFGGLAILAAIFGVINTQYISVMERTRQIGLMKAFGVSRRDIARLFRYEAAWLGVFGGIVGVVIAFLLSLLNPVLANIMGLEEGLKMLRVDVVQAVVLVLCLALVTMLAGFFPSRRAAKLDPIKALRTE